MYGQRLYTQDMSGALFRVGVVRLSESDSRCVQGRHSAVPVNGAMYINYHLQ